MVALSTRTLSVIARHTPGLGLTIALSSKLSLVRGETMVSKAIAQAVSAPSRWFAMLVAAVLICLFVIACILCMHMPTMPPGRSRITGSRSSKR